ncbi:MAG: FGGY family carbohydrate kinase [Candidatus Omnitrophota bacterium]
MILVIDSGTTNTKAFFFDHRGNIVAGTASPTKTFHLLSGKVEQRAEDWWKSAVEAIKKLRLQKHPEIEAIVTSSQGGTFVALDKGLKPLGPGITWLDNRAESIAKGLDSKYGKDFFFRKTGHYLEGWCPTAVILWLQKNEPVPFHRIRRISFVADYLNQKLTGRFFIDQTAAGMTSFFNINSGDWDKELLDIVRMKKETLPELIPAGSIGGKLNREAANILNLKEGIPVISGGHDQYCASLGAGAVGPGDCLISCGTAWALLVCTKKPVFKTNSFWSPGRHLKKDYFGLMRAMGDGGVVLDWLKKNLRFSMDSRLLHAGMTERKYAGIRVPLSIGLERATLKVEPYFSRGKGTIRNLSLASKPEEIYLAALKALVNEVNAYLEQIRNELVIKKLFLVGGGAKEPLLAPMLSEFTKLKVSVPEVTEAAAKGAALLAL